ncbi:hypothetical protein H0H81_003707 [Sphagnurus paluster]|uniref:F-box domain-containing protein n=1 Tax=Sphagnurus paluster TaxID=117069 RepID=A0A9P7KK57_9AGAR|nr:hypothetical protein H0H81_003707 [Sphagnurus paluster]
MMSNHALLEKTTIRLEILQRNKARLLAEFQKINKELQDTNTVYCQLKNRTTPIYKLPDELLSDIFQRCHAIMMGSRGRPFEVLVSHVSSDWRNLALNTPLLWNMINLEVHERTRGRIAQRLSAYLTRSSECLLDLSLRFSIADGLKDFLELLAPHAGRWYRVSICCTHRSTLPDDIYGPLHSIAAPALIHLSLRIDHPGDDTDVPRRVYPGAGQPIITIGAPSLCFVRVAGKVFGNLTPPLSAIQTFHVDAWPKNLMSLSQFRAMLDALPCLVNLSLSGLSVQLPRDPLELSEPIPLLRLRSLRIRDVSTPCHRLFHLLSLPILESITLSSLDTFDSGVIPTVVTLSLESCMLQNRQLENMFRAFPNVSTLYLDETTPEIYPLLHENPKGEWVWPALKSIFVKRLPSADVAFFCLMLYARLKSTPPLCSLYLDKRSRTVLLAKEFLEPLREVLDVTNCDQDAPWPADLGYEDPDDDWY